MAILVSSIIVFFFIGLAGAGLARPESPRFGALAITGFIGLALSSAFLMIPSSLVAEEMIKAGYIDYDQYLHLHRVVTPWVQWLPGSVMLILGIVGLVYRRHASSLSFVAFGFWGAYIALFLLGFFLPTEGYWHSTKADEAQTKANAHAIQVALEQYSADRSGLYPDSIETLISDGYLVQLPENPFTGQQMEEVLYGSSCCYGNFTYLPVSAGGNVLGYYLIAYGYRMTPGMRLVGPDSEDHVIIVLTNEDRPKWPADVPFPDVKTAIESAPH